MATTDISSNKLKAFTNQTDEGNTNLSALMFSNLVSGLPTPPTSSPITDSALNNLASLVTSNTNNPVIPNVTSITSGSTSVTSPTGIFDVMMKAVVAQLDSMYNTDKISLSEYATIYANLINTALAQAIKFALEKDATYWNAITARNKAVTALVEASVANASLANNASQAYQYQAAYALQKAKLATEDRTYAKVQQEINSEKAKEALLNRQAQSFNEDFKQKILKILLDNWSVVYSVASDAGSSEVIPNAVTAYAINEYFNDIIRETDPASRFNPSTGTTTTSSSTLTELQNTAQSTDDSTASS